MAGWIKLHRTLFDHWIAQDNDYLAVWVRMLTEANFEDKSRLFNGSLVKVERGQIIFGLQAWSEKTGVSISKLRRLISMLESDSMISRQAFNKFSLISITNYDSHQASDRQDDKQTAGEPQANDRQPATPKEVNKSKNGKNGKNGKNNIGDLDFSLWPEMPSKQLFEDWIAVRKVKRAAMTQTAIDQMGHELQKAAAMGWSVEDALSHAVASGWQGLNAKWLAGVKSSDHKKSGFTIDVAQSQVQGFLND